MTDRITHPGMFEGQMAYMPEAYAQYMDGFCQDDGDVITVEIDWEGAKREVSFVVTDQGFVEEV
jgi:hypothetical protein